MSFANPKLKLRGILVGHIGKILTKDGRSSSDSKPTLQSFQSWESDLASTLRKTADAGCTGAAASFCDRLWWLAIMGTPSSGRWPVTDFERRQLLAAYEVFVGIRQLPDSLDIDKRHDWYEEESAFYRKALKFDKYRPFVTSNGYPGLGQASCNIPRLLRAVHDTPTGRWRLPFEWTFLCLGCYGWGGDGKWPGLPGNCPGLKGEM
jgi:hypothetical protein